MTAQQGSLDVPRAGSSAGTHSCESLCTLFAEGKKKLLEDRRSTALAKDPRRRRFLVPDPTRWAANPTLVTSTSARRPIRQPRKGSPPRRQPRRRNDTAQLVHVARDGEAHGGPPMWQAVSPTHDCPSLGRLADGVIVSSTRPPAMRWGCTGACPSRAATRPPGL